MFSLPVALTFVLAPLALLGIFLWWWFRTQKTLREDPDLQEFMRRVEAGRSGTADASPEGQAVPDERGSEK